MYISARARLILEYMFTTKEQVTTDLLADYMSVSIRTIRRDLKAISEILKSHRLLLERSRNQILHIVGSDSDKQTFKWQLFDLSYNEFTPFERQQLILKILLQKETVKLISLASDLSVTVSTISNDLTKIEEELPEGVEIERRRGAGIRLKGDELKKRAMFRDHVAKIFPPKKLFHLFQGESNEGAAIQESSERLLHLIDKEIILKVERKARKWRRALSFQITDEAYLNLVIHIAISVHRTLAGYCLEDKQESEFVNYPEYCTAKSLLAAILGRDEKDIPNSEVIYLTMHLRCIKANEFGGNDFPENEHILATKLAKQLIERVEKQINKKFVDRALLKGLRAHLRPALRRLNDDMRIHNPLLDSIKADYPDLFEIVHKAFTSLYTQKVPDEEIGFLVLHFGAALLSLEEKTTFTGIVVCASGIGTSKMLVTRLKQAIPQLKHLETISLFELKQALETTKFDVVISTIDLGDTDFNYFLVSPMLCEREISQIEVYLHEKNSTYHHHKEEVKKQHLTLREAVHRLENKQIYIKTIIDILKNFQVVKIDQVSSDLNDMIRAILMRIMEKNQTIQVELLLKSLVSQRKPANFAIDGTKIAFFHTRTEHIDKPVFQISPLSEAIQVPSMNGEKIAASTFIIMIAPEKFSKQGLEALSYMSSSLIESEETTLIFESGHVNHITQHVICRLNQFLEEKK